MKDKQITNDQRYLLLELADLSLAATKRVKLKVESFSPLFKG